MNFQFNISKHVLNLCLVTVFAFFASSTTYSQAQEIVWYPDLSSATAAAAKNNKLVMMHFTASWCRPCKTLNTFVFSNPSVQRAFEDNVIAVKIDVDANPELGQTYGVNSVPYDVAMTPSGRVISKRKSPKDPSGYTRMVQGFSTILSERQNGQSPGIAQNLAELQEAMQSKFPKFEGQPTSFTPDAPSYQAPAPSRHSSELQRKSRIISNPFTAPSPQAAPQPRRVANAFVKQNYSQPQHQFNRQFQGQGNAQGGQGFQVEPRIQGSIVQDRSFAPSEPNDSPALTVPPTMHQVQTSGPAAQLPGLDQASIENIFGSQLNAPQDQSPPKLTNEFANPQQEIVQPMQSFEHPQSFENSPSFVHPSDIAQSPSFDQEIAPPPSDQDWIAPGPVGSNQVQSQNQLPNNPVELSPPQSQSDSPVDFNVPDIVQGEFQFNKEPPYQSGQPAAKTIANVAPSVPPRNVALQRLEQSDVAAKLIWEKAQQKRNAFQVDPKLVTDDRFYGTPRAIQTDGINGNYHAKIKLPSVDKQVPDSNDFAPQAKQSLTAQIINNGPSRHDELMPAVEQPPELSATRQRTKAMTVSSKKMVGPAARSPQPKNEFVGSSSLGIEQASAQPAAPEFALHGKCPVTLLTQSKWVDGDKNWGCVHRNRIYVFASQENLDLFQSDPDAYSPILAGYDPVVFHETGKLVDGHEKHGVFMGKVPHQRIVLFTDSNTRARFQLDPRKYLENVRQAMSNSGGSSSTLIR